MPPKTACPVVQRMGGDFDFRLGVGDDPALEIGVSGNIHGHSPCKRFVAELYRQPQYDRLSGFQLTLDWSNVGDIIT